MCWQGERSAAIRPVGKKWICHSVARQSRQVGGCCVLVGIGLALRRRVGKAIRIDVVCLRQVELTREKVHHTYKIARRSSDSISNGNSSVITRWQHEPIQ